MAKRVVLIKHEKSPPADRASSWLAEQGYELDWRAPFAGESLGEPDGDLAGTVIYGGGQGLDEQDRYPFLADELRWVERCMARDVPVLGLCLGGQIVSHALGAAVGPGPGGHHEFGYYKIFATEEGRSLFPKELTVAQAHFHEFSVPEGAMLLAGSEFYAHQAIRYGERTFAFQFHPEVTLEGFKRWQDAAWAPWGAPGAQSRAEQDALAPEADRAQDRWFRGFLAKLFGPAGTS